MVSPNYGDTEFKGGLAPFTPQLNPVEDRSDIFLAQQQTAADKNMVDAIDTQIGSLNTEAQSYIEGAKGFDSISQGIANSTPFFKAAYQANLNSGKDGVLASFQQDMLLIADAVEQGMSVPEARMRMRALNSQYVADNPSLLEDINKTQSQLVNTFGLASIATTGNEEFERNKKLEDEAVNGGWVGPDGDTATGVANMLQAKRDTEGLAAFKRTVDLQLANHQQITEQQQYEATQRLKTFVSSTQPWVDATIANARQQMDAGGDKAIILQQVQDTISGEMSKAGFLKGMGAEGDISYMVSGVDKMLTALNDYATGKTSQEQLDASIKKAKGLQELSLRLDPELGQIAAFNEMFGNVSPDLVVRLNVRAGELLAGSLKTPQVDDQGNVTYAKPSDYVGANDPDINTALAAAEDGIKTTLTNPTPGSVEAASGLITDVLRSVKSYSAGAEEATDFKAVIEFLASPNVGKMAEQQKAVIPQGVKDKATFVIQEQYEKVLLPLIRKRFEQAQIEINKAGELAGTAGMANLPDASVSDKSTVSGSIEPFWNGSGVEFRAKAGLESNAAIQAVVNSLNEGNDSIAGPLNTLIRASAHIQGSTDYKGVYEGSLVQRLWGSPDNPLGSPTVDPVGKQPDIDELAGGNIPLELSNVVQPVKPAGVGFTPTAYNEPKAATLLDAIGSAEGAAYNTTYDYTTSPGGVNEGLDITKMTISEIQSLQKKMVTEQGFPSGAMGKYQIIGPTLKKLVKKMGLTGKEVFSPELQDAMALYLLHNDTSFDQWLTGNANNKQFQQELAGIWASVPDLSGKSHYKDDGINKATEGGQALLGLL